MLKVVQRRSKCMFRCTTTYMVLWCFAYYCCLCFVLNQALIAENTSNHLHCSQGERYGWNQAQCDDAFKRDMYKLCEKSVKRKRFLFSSAAKLVKMLLANKVKRCKTVGADLYYKAVRTFGKLYWEKNPPSWCNPACAKNRGDPTKLLNV